MDTKMKMQNVSFRNVDEFLEFLPEDELKITSYLRQLVLNCIPDVTEKLAYNVPYYKRHRNICFIWPASIMWGKRKTYNGVRFGFTNGYLLRDEMAYLDRETRKQVFWKDFTSITQIDTNLLKAYIFEAVDIDKQLTQKHYGIQRKSGK